MQFYAKNVDAASALELKKTLTAYDRTLLIADPRRMEPKSQSPFRAPQTPVIHLFAGRFSRRGSGTDVLLLPALCFFSPSQSSVDPVPALVSRRCAPISRSCIHSRCRALTLMPRSRRSVLPLICSAHLSREAGRVDYGLCSLPTSMACSALMELPD